MDHVPVPRVLLSAATMTARVLGFFITAAQAAARRVVLDALWQCSTRDCYGAWLVDAGVTARVGAVTSTPGGASAEPRGDLGGGDRQGREGAGAPREVGQRTFHWARASRRAAKAMAASTGGVGGGAAARARTRGRGPRAPHRLESRSSAICTALSAAPWRLSATIQRLIAPFTARSSRTRPTKTCVGAPARRSAAGGALARTAHPSARRRARS